MPAGSGEAPARSRFPSGPSTGRCADLRPDASGSARRRAGRTLKGPEARSASSNGHDPIHWQFPVVIVDLVAVMIIAAEPPRLITARNLSYSPSTVGSDLGTNDRKRLRARSVMRDRNRHPARLVEALFEQGRAGQGVRIMRRILIFLIVGLLSATGLIARPRAASAAIPGHIADAAISSCPTTGATVPPDYLGLSMEWSMVEF